MCKNKQHPFSKDNGLISKVWSKSASSTAFFSTLASLRTWSGGLHQWDFALPTFGVGHPSDPVLRNNGNKNPILLSRKVEVQPRWWLQWDTEEYKKLTKHPYLCSTSIISVSLPVNSVRTPKFNMILFKKISQKHVHLDPSIFCSSLGVEWVGNCCNLYLGILPRCSCPVAQEKLPLSLPSEPNPWSA